MSARLALATLAGTMMLAAPAGAQSWRTVLAARQARPVDTLRVRLDYTVGALAFQAGADSLLYQARLRYDADRFQPLREYDAATGTLRLGVRGDDRTPLRVGSGREHGSLRVAVSPGQPIDLDLDLGATDAELDLTGLAVSRLAIGSGASEIRVRFDRPNPIAMSELEIDVGIASVEVRGLGHANAERVRVHGAIGSVDLDFAGTWSGTRTVQVAVTLGSATVRVPRGTAVRVRHARVLGTFDANGLEPDGDEWVSGDWTGASQRLIIDARTTFGALDLRFTGE